MSITSYKSLLFIDVSAYFWKCFGANVLLSGFLCVGLLNLVCGVLFGDRSMSLSKSQEDKVRKQPFIETKLFKSKSGKHVVWQTIITEVKPVEYMQTVLDSAADSEQLVELEA